MKSQDILLLFKLVVLNLKEKKFDNMADEELAFELFSLEHEPVSFLDGGWRDWDLDLPSEEETLDKNVAFTMKDEGLRWKWERDLRKGLSLGERKALSQYAAEIHQIRRFENGEKWWIHREYSVRSLETSTGISRTQVSVSLSRCYQSGLAYPDIVFNVPRVNMTALYEFVVYGLRYVFPAERGQITRGISTASAAPVLADSILSGGELPFVWPDVRGRTKGVSLEPIYKTVPKAVRQDEHLYALLALVDSIRIGQARERTAAIKLLKEKMELEYDR